jgi:uncharacterized protein with HEPN domain
VPSRSALPRLGDIIDAIERIRSVTTSISLDAFEADWQKRWIVERGAEIISEASRRLPDDLKARHPESPWSRVAAIGNILRHEYERIAPAVLWKMSLDELSPLERVCRFEYQQALDEENKG